MINNRLLKSISISVLMGCLCWTTEIKAENNSAVQKIVEQASQGKAISRELSLQADHEKNSIEAQIDVVLNQLLAIPFKYRQYVFPSILDEPGIPKKIRTHPEIAIWEGKLPTDIAPEAKEFADKYLEDLKPNMYIYLSPEAYHSEKQKDLPIQTGIKGQSLLMPEDDFMKVIKSHENYPEIADFMKLPDNLVEDPDQSVLTMEHIQKMEAGISAFDNYIKTQNETNPIFKSGYRALGRYHMDKYAAYINPFGERLKLIRLMGKEFEMDKALKAAGWDSAEDFAVTADTMAKAYRAARMPLTIAFAARRYRGKTPKTELEKMLVTRFMMYDALPADIHLVDQNLNQVRQAFIKTGNQMILNAEVLDETRD